MNKLATPGSNVSVLEALPVTALKAELEKFKNSLPHLHVGEAARIMKITQQGARILHDRCESISAGRDDLGHRLFRRDGCVAYRWFRLSFGTSCEDSEIGGWDVE